MKISRLNPAVLGGGVIFLGALALIAPLLSARREAPYTLVSTGLDMSPKSSDWLALNDGRDPAAWLAGRSSPPGDATRLAAQLAETARHYEETPRMIANRVAQISDEIEGADPLALLRDFSMDLPRTHSFGALAQHYLVLRRQGIAHADALGVLREQEDEK